MLATGWWAKLLHHWSLHVWGVCLCNLILNLSTNLLTTSIVILWLLSSRLGNNHPPKILITKPACSSIHSCAMYYCTAAVLHKFTPFFPPLGTLWHRSAAISSLPSPPCLCLLPDRVHTLHCTNSHWTCGCPVHLCLPHLHAQCLSQAGLLPSFP